MTKRDFTSAVELPHTTLFLPTAMTFVSYEFVVVPARIQLLGIPKGCLRTSVLCKLMPLSNQQLRSLIFPFIQSYDLLITRDARYCRCMDMLGGLESDG
jgi:hypothetical protein